MKPNMSLDPLVKRKIVLACIKNTLKLNDSKIEKVVNAIYKKALDENINPSEELFEVMGHVQKYKRLPKEYRSLW